LRSTAAAYLVALVAVAAAVVLRLLLDPILGHTLPLVTLFGAVAAAVWLGGYRPAVLAALLGYVACAYLFIDPRGAFGLDDPRNLLGFVAYLLTCAIIIGFGEAFRVAERRAQAGRETLRVTLASMGDAVITTDPRGHVTTLNSVAERLTGWTQAEAQGRPLETVFRLVSEQTQEAVENPAARALRDGAVVGLANHTVLIRKDGTQHPIDDSAAPVFDRDGTVVGCVLLFRDVSERRRAEQALVASERHFRTIFETVAISLWEQDFSDVVKALDELRSHGVTDFARYLREHPDFVERALGLVRVIDVNDATLRLFEAHDKHEIFASLQKLFLPETAQAFAAQLVALAEGREYYEAETRLKTLRDNVLDVFFSMALPARNRIDGRVVLSVVDVTELKRAETSLREADRRKDEFLATLAHELRGPLAPLRNALEMMKHASSHPALIEQSRATMERQLSQLVRLVDDLIDVSRITRDRIELRMERVELASIIQQSIEACRSLAACSAQEITAELPGRPVYLRADAVRLAQVFTNILNNACKYSDRNGRIDLAAVRDGDEVHVSIRDSGVGIAPEHLSSVFDMFTQLDRTLERAHGGLGIGLSLVKRLVEMHGGRVTAASEGPGRGSEFVVRLPVLEMQEDAEPEPTAPAAPPCGGGPRRFLIVDDNVDAAASLAMLLEIGGHEAHVAHNGEDAVERARELQPDIILLDIGLPRMNGYDACRKIRAESWGYGTVLVALTGWGQDADRRRSRDAGFDHHLVKPVDPDELMRLLARTHDPRP